MENHPDLSESLTPYQLTAKPAATIDATAVSSTASVTHSTAASAATVSIRLSEIVAFVAPDARLVGVHLSALRSGKSLEPLCIDSEWVEHWFDGQDGREYLGMGYALIEGNDRHAALLAHLGGHSQCQVTMQGLEPIKGWK